MTYTNGLDSFTAMSNSNISIAGRYIRLETLSISHLPGLEQCLLGEPDGWFSLHHRINSPENLRSAIENRLKLNESKASRSFVIFDLRSEKIAGISHFMKVDNRDRQIEIGGTQVGRAFRKTYVNTETKFLLLVEAFEALKMLRVYFRVDIENYISQKAILRIGAKLEGTLRNEWILPDGRIRNVYVYSIIYQDWPELKKELEKQIAR